MNLLLGILKLIINNEPRVSKWTTVVVFLIILIRYEIDNRTDDFEPLISSVKNMIRLEEKCYFEVQFLPIYFYFFDKFLSANNTILKFT